MSYTPPKTWVPLEALDADDIKLNDDEMKLYVNQEIIPGDITANSLDLSNIQRGEYDPITESYIFTSGIIKGKNKNTQAFNRAYFTSETKAASQTNTISWQPLWDCCETVEVEVQSTAQITFSCTIRCYRNADNAVSPFDVTHPGRGTWASEVYLRQILPDGVEYLRGDTRSWAFEEGWSVDTVSGNRDPGGYGNYCRRQIGWTFQQDMAPGIHQFQIVINPDVESGYVSARNFLVETFDI